MVAGQQPLHDQQPCLAVTDGVDGADGSSRAVDDPGVIAQPVDAAAQQQNQRQVLLYWFLTIVFVVI
jgi:hypothetical protein